MKIDTPLHAEHQLDQVAGQFAPWRQTRTQPRERIPAPLWDQAVVFFGAVAPKNTKDPINQRLKTGARRERNGTRFQPDGRDDTT